MDSNFPRILREQRTFQAMIQIYCRDHHAPLDARCPNCEALRAYAMQLLDHCVFQGEKPTCVKCPVHCYKKGQRERVKVVMRYAGPKMVIIHPLMTALHWIDGFHKAQPIVPRKTR